MSSLVKNAAAYLGSNAVIAVIPLVLLPTLTHYMTPNEYGQAATFQSLLNASAIFVGLNFSGAVSVQWFKLDKENISKYIGSCIMIMFFVTAVLSLLIFTFSGTTERLFHIGANWILFSVSIAILVNFSNIRTVIWQSQGRAVRYGLFNVTFALSNAITTVLLVVALLKGGDGRIIAIATSTAAFGLLAFTLLAKDGLINLRWDLESARNALSFGLPLIPHAFAAWAMAQGDRFIIGNQLGLSQAGIYATAMQLGLPIAMGAEAFNRAYAPWLFSRLSKGQTEVGLFVSLSALMVAICGTAAYGIAAHFFLPHLISERFAASTLLLLAILPGVAAQAAYYLAVNFIFYSEKIRLLPIITLSSAAAYISVGYYMVVHYGPFGLATSFSMIQLFQTVAVFILASHTMKFSWLDLGAYRRGLALMKSATNL